MSKSDYIERLIKSRAEAAINDTAWGIKCGEEWAKESAEWPELKAIGALHDLDKLETYDHLARVLDEHGYESDFFERVFGVERPTDGMIGGFVKSARSIMNQVDAEA